MRVSVVLAVWNGERYLDEALRSVLAQTRQPDEIVAVDDGSVDGTASILAAYPSIRTLRQPNAGPAISRNRGVSEAAGDVVALLDHDDVWEPHKLALQVAALEADPALGFALCAIDNFLTPGLPAVPAWVDRRAIGVPQPGFGTGSLVVRRSAFERVGPFDPATAPCDDSDWLVRALDAGIRFIHLDQALVRRRIHDRNLSNDSRGPAYRHAMMARILHASLVRRRAVAGGGRGADRAPCEHSKTGA